MGRWRATLLLSRLAKSTHFNSTHRHFTFISPAIKFVDFSPPFSSLISRPVCQNSILRSFSFSAIPSPIYTNDDGEFDDFTRDYSDSMPLDSKDIPVRAYFLCTNIDLKSMQAEYSSNVVPPISRSSNYIALRFCNFPSETTTKVATNVSCSRYMLVFQYGSAVLFNMEEHEVESYLEIIRRHASGLLSELRKDDYAVKEKPQMVEDMQGGSDYIVLKNLDTDSIRIIGSVLGQSIALDYFISQIDDMVEEFADINRGMEKSGTFTMNRKKLFQLVGKANSNLADVILKVGLFDRSEIAWRDAKYAQIHEYMREEYEVAQRFGDLNFKLKFVEHNIHFLQEVLQNRKSDLLEWCVIVLLTIENIIGIYEIICG